MKSLRDTEILRRMRRDRVVSVEVLAQDLRVSSSTIRRDLQRLEAKGAVVRVHGGAALIADEGVDATAHFLVDGHCASRADMEAVATRAAPLVSQGDVILLDVGTTALLLARRLRGQRVTVVTSSLAIFDELRDDPEVELVLLGGVLRRPGLSCVGSLTEDALRQIRARWAFLTASGVAPDGAILEARLDDVPIKRAMIGAADHLVVLADRDKIPGHGIVRVCPAAAVTYLITNDGADGAFVTDWAAHGMEVLTA